MVCIPKGNCLADFVNGEGPNGDHIADSLVAKGRRLLN